MNIQILFISIFQNFNHELIFKDLSGIDDLVNRILIKFNLDNKDLDNTLIFLDKIQECNEAIISLKIINEIKQKN